MLPEIFSAKSSKALSLLRLRNRKQSVSPVSVQRGQLYVDLDGKQYDVLMKELDYDSMTRQIIEMDFQALVKGEKSTLLQRSFFTTKRWLLKVS